MDTKERIAKAFEYLRFNHISETHAEVAETMGANRANVSAAINGNPRYLTNKFLNRFADTYSSYINKHWLLTGEGQLEIADKTMRPHYPANVTAGVLAGEIEAVKDTDVVYEPIIKRLPQYDYTIDVAGHSMEPTYSDKGMVACRKLYNWDEIKFGKAYVIATKEGAVLKRIVSKTLSSIRVVSDNPDPQYKPYNIDTDLILSIDEVVGSVNVGNPTKGYINYLTDAMLEKMQERINKGIEDRRKFKEEMEDIIRKMASGIYSDNN